MAAITEGQLVSHLDTFITGHLQNPGNSSIDDFHTVLRGRAVTQFNFAAGGASGTTGVAGVLCATVSATVTAVAAAIAVPIGVLVHQHMQSAVERNIDQLKTRWRTWYGSYCSSWRATVLHQANRFARQTNQQNPSQMDTDHYPELERGFLEFAGAPCRAYVYVRVWNHIAYHWDRACSQQARASGSIIQGSALQGPNGILMPCRTLGRRDAYGAALPSATDPEARRPAHIAMPQERHRMTITNL